MSYIERRRNSWAEDDFTLPQGVMRLDTDEPQSGRTYLMYHGTSKEAARNIQAYGFRQSAGGMLGPGVYLSRDLEKASRYPLELEEHQRVVLRMKVSVGKVIKIDYQGHKYQKTWHDHGYDTAWVPPNCGMVKSGLQENCVWDPDRIKVLKVISRRSQQPAQTRNEDTAMPFLLGVAGVAVAALFLLLGLKS